MDTKEHESYFVSIRVLSWLKINRPAKAGRGTLWMAFKKIDLMVFHNL